MKKLRKKNNETTMSAKVFFAWSGGKDSAQALYGLKKNDNYEIVAADDGDARL